MTEGQREDLYIEWEITFTSDKEKIKEKYQQQFGEEQSVEHWEEYLADALNLRQQWIRNGVH